MKKILTFFVAVLLIGGCNGGSILENTPPTTTTIVELGNPASPQKALVMGNSNYEAENSGLENPINDAVDMANLLANEMGFHVIRATNLNYQEMSNVLHDFQQRLTKNQVSGQKKVGLFYYSGHGARSNQDDNYLIPTNNGRIKTEYDLRHKAFNVRRVIVEPMEQIKGHVNIIIADACRNNPYEGRSREIGLPRGLARLNPPPPTTSEKLGALIAFAASENEVADDGGEKHGLYTKHLLAKMRNGKHKLIEDVFMEVRGPVASESHGDQNPWYESTLAVEYCLGGCPKR